MVYGIHHNIAVCVWSCDMPPKKRKATTPRPETVKRTREETANVRLEKKNDRSVDNLRNRLIDRFGLDYVKKVDGSLPSESLYQEQMMITCFERLRGLEDGKGVDIRERVVTCGLKTVIHEHLREDIVNTLMILSDFVSKVRVSASLLANYVNMKCMEEGVPLPVASAVFFKHCLNCFSGSGGASDLVNRHFNEFVTRTGLLPVHQWSKGSIDQAFVYQSKDMAAAASTYIEVHYKKRLQTLVRWAIRRRVVRPAHMAPRTFGGLLNKLAVWVTSRREEMDVVAALRAKMDELGIQGFDDIEPLCCEILDWDLLLGHEPTFEDRRLHLLEMYDRYVNDDRRSFENVWKNLHSSHPGDENKKVRCALFKQTSWADYPAPPKATCPLPVCHTGATFVRVDKKMMQRLFPHLENVQGPWGWRSFMDPFSKEANIPCLGRRKNWYARSERGMMKAIAATDPHYGVSECPWLIGPTFETDGKQIKLRLLSSERSNASIPGLPQLSRAGYGSVSTAPSLLSELLHRGNGVYRLEHVEGEAGALQGVEITAVDPGQVHPIHCVCARGAVWSDLVEVVNGSDRVDDVFVTEGEYGEWIGREAWQKHETRRRIDTPYGRALEVLLQQRQRTIIPDEFLSYCTAFAEHQDAIWTELLTRQRRFRKFVRFRKVMSASEKLAEAIAPMRDKGAQRIVFFGAATFRSQKGRASAPLKKVVRAVAQRAVTVMTPEGGTSK